ncbi:MAG: ParB/RepB/Spo0J family partition protein [Candidatus Nanopelagicales bacterium]
MAKLSGLIIKDKIHTADPSIVASMPSMSETKDTVLTEPDTTIQEKITNTVKLTPETHETLIDIPIDRIRRSPFQVRTMGDESYIEALMESILKSGVISPIVIRPLPCDTLSPDTPLYEFIAGEHRALACRRLGYVTIKAIVRHLTDKEAALALVTDNAVRKNMDDYDRYKHAIMLRTNGFCRTASDVAIALGMAKSNVTMLSVFSTISAEASAILQANPGILGVFNAYKLRDLITQHPTLFAMALKAVADGKIKQAGIRHWIQTQLRQTSATVDKTTIKIDKQGAPSISLIIGDNEIVIRGEGLDSARLRKLIEAHLEEVMPNKEDKKFKP